MLTICHGSGPALPVFTAPVGWLDHHGEWDKKGKPNM
jgi:hypothetical protein